MTETVTIPVGNIVICDACNGDYTASDALGGMVCGTWAICPKCAPEWRDYRPKNQVRRAQDWLPFREFILAYRGPDAAIKLIPGER